MIHRSREGFWFLSAIRLPAASSSGGCHDTSSRHGYRPCPYFTLFALCLGAGRALAQISGLFNVIAGPVGQALYFDGSSYIQIAAAGLPSGDGERTLVLWSRLDELLPPYPNPINPSTSIRYRLASAVGVRLSVYTVTGQLVRRLVVARQDTGSYQVTWDGRDASGAPVGSRVYLCRLEAGDFRAVTRLALVK